jgi:hypothetical protein
MPTILGSGEHRYRVAIGKVGVTDWKTSFPDTPAPAVVRYLQKLERV